MALPKQYDWLNHEGAPKMLVENIRHYGTLEHKGVGSNPDITAWAKEIGGKVADVYKSDDIAWCGLYMGILAKRSGYDLPKDPLWALNWGTFGKMIEKHEAMLGDVLVFVRNGGGHVSMYIGETNLTYFVMGGNQSDAVTITEIAKTRLYAVRRPVFRVGQPANVRKIHLTSTGNLSTNEA